MKPPPFDYVVARSPEDAVAQTESARVPRLVDPAPAACDIYEAHYRKYRALYPALRETMGGRCAPLPREEA